MEEIQDDDGAYPRRIDGNVHKYTDLTGRIIRCAMNVHCELGNGFREVIYQRALAIELTDAGIPFEREFVMPVYYKGNRIGTQRADFLVQEIVSVELKAHMMMEPADFAQAINHLEAYKLDVGLLINFGAPSLQFRRLTNRKITGI